MNLAKVLLLVAILIGMFFCIGRCQGSGSNDNDTEKIVVYRITTNGTKIVDMDSDLDIESCSRGVPGVKGMKGLPGENGYTGEDGRSGRYFDKVSPPVGVRCSCETYITHGERGKKGEIGEWGSRGEMGDRGPTGPRGKLGESGPPGPPGNPGPVPLAIRSPAVPGMMYIPINSVVYSNKSRSLPQVMCHHFRRQAYVPGIPNSWLGWYETGKSGYLVHDNWLYHSTRFVCPCSVEAPPAPSMTPPM